MLTGGRPVSLFQFVAAIIRKTGGPGKKLQHGFSFRKWNQIFHLLHNIGEIMVRLQTIQHCCFRYAVHGCACLSPADTLCKQPAPSSCRKVFQRPFRRQIINTQVPVFQIFLQIGFLVQGIKDCLPDLRRTVYCLPQCMKPLKESL